jgi:hypothetical protein
MKSLTNLITLTIVTLFFHLLCSFVAWDLDMANWGPFIRAIYIISLVLSYFKIIINDNSKN